MPDWQFRAYDLVTNAYYGQVAVTSWTHTDTLSGSGSWSATLAPAGNPGNTRLALGATREGRATLVPWRNSGLPGEIFRPVDGFTGWVPPGGRRTPDLAGGGLLQYLDQRAIKTTTVFSGADQFTMAAGLVALAAPYGPTIDTSQVGLSGIPRDQTWFPWEVKSIGEALRQKSALLNGFDFALGTELDGDTVVRRLRCWYPRRGKMWAEQQCPVFRAGDGGNLLDVPRPAGEPRFCTDVVAVGAETDPVTRERLVATQRSVELLAAGWPELTFKLDLPDVKEMTTLQEHADGHIARWGKQATNELTLLVDPNDTTWPWDSYGLGDDCKVVVPAGVDPWWPDGMTSTRRIIGRQPTWISGVERFEVITEGAVLDDAGAGGAPIVIVPPVVVTPPPPVTEPPPAPPPVTEGYIEFPGTNGNYISIPDAAATSITGDICIVAKVAAADWTPGVLQVIPGKYFSSTNQRSYELRLETTGALSWQWSSNGTSISGTTGGLATSTVTLSALANLAVKRIAVTHDVDNGAAGNSVRFWTSDDGTTWTQLGATVTTAFITSFFDSTSKTSVGANNDGTLRPFAGRVYDVSVRSGIGAAGVVGGTEQFGIRPANIPADNGVTGATGQTFVCATGQTVTVARSGATTIDTLLVQTGSTAGEPAQVLGGFFPIGVDFQNSDSATLNKWAARGINTLIRSWPLNGDATAWSAAVQADGRFKQIRHPRPTPADDIGLTSLLAWSHRDEPDLISGQIAYETIRAQYDAWKVIDPARLVFVSVTGRMNSNDARYYPANDPDGSTSYGEPWYRKYFDAADWVCGDRYPVNQGSALTIVGAMVDQLDDWSGFLSKPVFAYIECSDYNTTDSNPAPSPDQMRGQMWSAICHGARGIFFFPERKDPSFLFDNTPAANATEMTAQAGRITALSAVLQNPIDPVGMSAAAASPMEVCWRTTSTHRYIIALNLSGATRTAQVVAVTGTGAATIAEVVGESRNVTIAAGEIVDTFTAYAAHVYKIVI